MSIRTRLLLLTLLATALPALLLLARFFHDRERAIEADTAILASFAQRRADILADKVSGTAQLLYGLARASDLHSNDRAACSSFLSDVRGAYPQYTGILTIKPDGALFCDSLRTGRELDLRDRNYFKAAVALREPKVVLEPAFGRLTGVAVLQIAYPVRSATGELQFVLLASLNLQKLFDGDAPPLPGAGLVVFDRKGMVFAGSHGRNAAYPEGSSLAGTPLHAFAIGHAAATSAEIADASGGNPGIWALANEASLGDTGLRLAAGAPKSALLATANRRFGEDIALLAALAGTLFLVVWFFAEIVLLRQIMRSARMARRLAEGDLGARIAPPLPRGELGDLMARLNHAAESLSRQHDDISKLNARLMQSQRLEAVGQLTGGVAHDFNNLLTVVMGNAELLVEQSTDPDQRVLAEMIVGAAERGAALTQQLLAFARKQALSPKPLDVNQLIAQMDSMLRRTLGEHIEIELIRAAGLWQAMVDQGQLENALLNLCLNARDAMLRGGRLTIETANTVLDQAYADSHPEVKPGQYVMLAVSDTGQGIAPQHLELVFQPFFTTKEKGKGTGLGLAMVYGFVKQSAGHINIYSEQGHGTAVKLYLPRALQGANAPLEPAERVMPTGGKETILVVEDDEMVRRYACQQLRSLGYRVIDMDNGADALNVIRQHESVDLLFTDVVMPGGMNGRALADAARALRPGLRVLYTSGYTENAIVHHGRLDPGVQLLAKPYRLVELSRAVRAALLQETVEGGDA